MSGYGAVSGGADGDTEFKKKNRCNDILFAVLFIAHLVLVIIELIAQKGKIEQEIDEINEDVSDLNLNFNGRGVYKFAGIICAVALILSTLALGFMAYFATLLIEISLISSIVICVGVAVYGLVIANWIIAGCGAAAFLLMGIFTCCIWKRIPFARANLRTAIKIIQTNFGLVIVSFILEFVAFIWAGVWIASAGVSINSMGKDMLFLYLVSFFWTCQVLNGIQQVIVASVVGTWWYKPEFANECWDDGLNGAIIRTFTLNLGSICFGSLFASIVQALRYMLRMSEANDDCKAVTCILQCILGCIQSMIEYFNKWAYTYVGIHGDSYIQSGKKVLKLFTQRGWVAIVADGLADTVMLFTSISIALVTGLAGWYLVTYDDDIFETVGIGADDDDLIGFVCGALIGLLFASIMMESVSSAVNAVIVCFAEAPGVFKQNYPEMCDEMLEAWRKAYPDECIDDFKTISVHDDDEF